MIAKCKTSTNPENHENVRKAFEAFVLLCLLVQVDTSTIGLDLPRPAGNLHQSDPHLAFFGNREEVAAQMAQPLRVLEALQFHLADVLTFVGEFDQVFRLIHHDPQMARLAMKRQSRRISLDMGNPKGTFELQRDPV